MLPLRWHAYVAAPILLLAANCLKACFKLSAAKPLHLELVEASPQARAGSGGYITRTGYTIHFSPAALLSLDCPQQERLVCPGQ
jgi:hypothetical protein